MDETIGTPEQLQLTVETQIEAIKALVEENCQLREEMARAVAILQTALAKEPCWVRKE